MAQIRAMVGESEGWNQTCTGAGALGSGGNRPLEPRTLEVEFFPMEEVLHEKVKVH